MPRPATAVARGLSTAVGVVLLVALAVIAAMAIGVVTTIDPGTVVPTARLSVSADAEADRIVLTHRSGDTLDVSELSVVVTVDGEPLDRQPPVPFFATRGFESGPTGPFNPASPDDWSAGEMASVTIASTNEPRLSPGDRVEVTVATEAGVVATVETVAR
jgi:FlaG/FlaF family flagellin (archaellin)